MKAILVNYLPATETKGVRLKAIADGVQAMTVGRDYEFTVEEQSKHLAEAFIRDARWTYKALHGGQLPNGDYCFVMEV